MKCENTSVMLSIKPIAYIHSDFSEKFGIPRQSGLVDSLQAKIIFTEEFRNGDCIRGIEEFSHLWLIWEFSKNQRDKWTPTVRRHPGPDHLLRVPVAQQNESNGVYCCPSYHLAFRRHESLPCQPLLLTYSPFCFPPTCTLHLSYLNTREQSLQFLIFPI